MIPENTTQDSAVAEVPQGLPELEGDLQNNNAKSGNKKPPFGFVIGLVGLLAVVGFGVQYAINHSGVFDKEPEIVEEPPIPVLPDEEVGSSTGGQFLVNDPILVGGAVVVEQPGSVASGDSQVSTTNIPFEQLKAVNDSLMLLAEEVRATAGELSQQRALLNKVMQNQNALIKQFEMDVARQKPTDEALAHGVNENQRWLVGISNQLKEIGVDVKEASQEFPIVVYSRNVWGNDVFLTVAQKAAPEQTSFLRVGGIVGRWRLIVINEKMAVFEHFEGNRKEVML